MADANDLTYRYAEQTWDADGVRTEYDISFDGGYIDQAYVFAFSTAVDPDTGLPTDRTAETLTFLSEATNPENGWKTAQVQITPAVASGRKVTIFRDTPKSAPLVSYQDGSVLTKNNLDLANNQAIMAIAEIMDGLQDANIQLDQTTQQTIDLTQLAQTLYEDVLKLLANGGIISSAPLVWSGTGDGTTTDFNIPGADIDDASFYDTYLGGAGLDPETDYTIVLQNSDPAQTAIHFPTAPADGVKWFSVLRGYSTPYSGPAPITSRSVETESIGPAETLTSDELYRVLKYSSLGDTTFTIPAGVGVDGAWFSLMTGSPAALQVVAGSGVTVLVPASLMAKTRGSNSTISATCLSPASNIWLLSGDLLPEQEDIQSYGGRSISDLGSVSGDVTVSLTDSDIFTLELTGDVVLSFGNTVAAGRVRDIELRITQDSTGGHAVTWPAGGVWPVETEYTVTQDAGKTDQIGLVITSDGSWTGYPVEDVG